MCMADATAMAVLAVCCYAKALGMLNRNSFIRLFTGIGGTGILRTLREMMEVASVGNRVSLSQTNQFALLMVSYTLAVFAATIMADHIDY